MKNKLRIQDKEFHENSYGTDRHLENWPLIYILENEKQAYVGQSNRAIRRMAEHKSVKEKRPFRKVHFIYSEEFNQSVTLDYESKLIQLMAADEHYILTNGNDGIADNNYYNKAYYDEYFPEVWEELRKKKIAVHTIDEIVNSDLFKYSPYKELNEGQRTAVEEILESIELDEKKPILVNGMPGSGKTIVAVFLLKSLKDKAEYRGKQIGLVIPQTSLRRTLKNLFKHIHGLSAGDVIGPSDTVKKKYDILLVDEAHRLHQRKNIPNMRAHDANNKRLGLPKDGTELDWVLEQTDCPILFYDQKQVIGPSGIGHDLMVEKIFKKKKKRMAAYYTLYSQMRVQGGNDYIDYVSSLLNCRTEEKKTFDSYEFHIVDQFQSFQELLLEKEESDGLSRMVAGYAWPWVSKKDKSKKDICIEGIYRRWNSRTENWVHSNTALDEVGCIHSIQGYDLNYAFVILGNDISYDNDLKKIVIKKDSYFDRNGKATATEKELAEYIKNIYYVLLTRGIKGTFLYVCDNALKEYLSGYIDII